MNNISNAFNMKKCCGCGACINICPTKAIEYSEDKYGFIIPNVDEEKCIDCGKCVNVCPFLNELEKEKNLKVIAATNRNKEEKFNSSSGGIFPVLAKYILRKKGIVFGSTMDGKFKVYHKGIENIEDISKISGSKYVQSHMKYIYQQVTEELEKGRHVLFAGTPCQIAALRLYLGMRESDKLITVEVVCHGVPSQKLFDGYLSFLQRKNNKDIVSYKFRAKKKADNGMNSFISYQFKGESKRNVKNWTLDSYNYNYMQGKVYRESCYECLYATNNRVSDFTLCDYWGWKNYHDEFSKNCSLSAVLVNTRKAEEIFNEVKESLVFCETDMNNVRKHNRCLQYPTLRHKNRDELLRVWVNEGYEFIDDKFNQENRFNIVKYKIMSVLPQPVIIFFHNILRRKK